ncbi:O-methyltransferase [Paludibacterium paludis]|uniref:O-methyltransferase n=1 Tax=Paludibacterium paludis TaxID=1225769 RepID=A0A918P131_9NEIS|nr:class I SAM-dependent methyltransferase [Paludibacterium paludis]GGY09612.1 O-methyltransferase [Paludibacterium paludis]
MTRRSPSFDSAIHDYLLKVGVTETPVQRELREFTATHRMAKMQIAPEQGQLLAWLARLTGVRRYLEIGVFTGYSALSVAQALPQDGEVVACDVSREFTGVAETYWQRAGVRDRIRLVLQPAMRTLDTLIGEERRAAGFDMAFIDADKPGTPDYYEACLTLVRPGGIIAIDNVFLGGRVVDPAKSDPPGVHVMHAFNASLVKDERVALCLLPIGDGMTLLMKR